MLLAVVWASAAFSLVFCSKSSDAAGATIAGIRSQAKMTIAKLKNLKFLNKNNFKKRVSMLRVG
jgi:hypothetical protein